MKKKLSKILWSFRKFQIQHLQKISAVYLIALGSKKSPSTGHKLNKPSWSEFWCELFEKSAAIWFSFPIRNQSVILSRPLWLQASELPSYRARGNWTPCACAHDFFWHNKLAQIATKKQLHCGINPSSISSKWASTEKFRLHSQVRKINLRHNH